MAGVSVKKVTFKQRIRRNGLRQRHKVASELRKRARLGRRVSNRYDSVAAASRPMSELVAAIAEGSAIPSQEVTLNPRELTDMLLQQASNNNNNNASSSSNNAMTRQPRKQDNVATTTTTAAPAAVAAAALPLQAIADCTAVALRDPTLVEAEERAAAAAAAGGGAHDDATAAGGAQRSKNQYRHHGQPYVFWQRVGVHERLLQALRAQRFTHPTPVQEMVLPELLAYATTSRVARGADADGKQRSSSSSKHSRKRRTSAAGEEPQQQEQYDVVVSAETGSGKTLVFALPILQDVLQYTQATATTADDDSNDSEATTTTRQQQRRRRARDAADDDASSSAARKKAARRESTTTTDGDDNGNEDDAAAEQLPSTSSSTRVTRVPERVMRSLVLTPTRELAMQIHDAMLQLTCCCDRRAVVVGCVVGGMAAEKQQRVLNRHPHVLIATPGRLWELVQQNEGCYLGHSISRRLRFVVLDEADKMLQSGRFDELRTLLERIHATTLPSGFAQARAATLRGSKGDDNNNNDDDKDDADSVLEAGQWDEETQTFIPAAKAAHDVSHKQDSDDKQPRRAVRAKDQPRAMTMPPPPPVDHRVCTVVTSATLTLQTNYERKDYKGNKSVIRTSNADVMGHVMQELHIKSSTARVFTVTPEAGVVAQINETHLRCPEDSKDLYLYYFLKTYGDARAIVFVNAISMLRRLVKLLEVLGIAVAGLHAAMQQRQRLKYIDKFRKGVVRVLVATDVASRGLDVDGVRYVLHYQVPRTTDAYIHRCGRTARCGAAGLSLLLVGAKEHVSFSKLMESLGRGGGGGGGGGSKPALETFALQPTVVHQLHTHLRLARQIDKLQKEIDKSNAQNRWVSNVSRQAELDVDDMYDDEAVSTNREKAKAVRLLRKQLDLLTSKFTGAYGGKGGFRTSAQALGAMQAERKLAERAGRQTLLVPQKKTKKKQPPPPSPQEQQQQQ